MLTAADPADLDPYDYAYGNPVTNEDPSGDRPTGANTCRSDEDDCSTVSPDQPSLNLTDVAEGALDGLYETGAGILAMGAYGQGEYGLAKSISNSPPPFANRDPDNPTSPPTPSSPPRPLKQPLPRARSGRCTICCYAIRTASSCAT